MKSNKKNILEKIVKKDYSNKLEKILEEETITTEEEREYQSKMINERNQKMANKLEEFLNNDQEVFMIVGLAHVIGKDGIIELLENKNYKINLIK